MHGSLSEHQKRITKLEMELQAMRTKFHEQSMKSNRVEGGSPTSTATRIVDDDLDDNEVLCPREVWELIEEMCPPDVRELIEEMFPELEDLHYFIWATDLEAERMRYYLAKERASMLIRMNNGEDEVILSIRSRAVAVLDSWVERWEVRQGLQK